MTTSTRTVVAVLFLVCVLSATGLGQHSDAGSYVTSHVGNSGQSLQVQVPKLGHFMLPSPRVRSLDALGDLSESSESRSFNFLPTIPIPIQNLPEPTFVVKDGAVFIAISALGPMSYIPLVGGGASGCIPGR